MMVEAYLCLRCEHYWLPRIRRRAIKPGVCPQCKSALWAQERRRAPHLPIMLPSLALPGNNGEQPAPAT